MSGYSADGADLNLCGLPQLEAGPALLGSGVLAACDRGGSGGIANVTGSLITRWREDPYAPGSCSYLAAGAQPLDQKAIATPIGDWLFFAGKATARPAPRHRPWRAALGQRTAREVTAADGGRTIVFDEVFWDCDVEVIGYVAFDGVLRILAEPVPVHGRTGPRRLQHG